MPATIFSGSKIKALKKELQLSTGASVISGTTDPTSTAVDAVTGSIYINESTGILYKKLDDGSSTNWEKIGETNNTEYISNGRAEAGATTGWTRYANTSAGNTPDDFGGTPNANVTWTITSSALRGNGSFRLTKDANNRQGEGVYYGFTLENADLHSVLKLAMDANTSANYADGDIRFYLVGSNDSFSSDFDIIEVQQTELLAGEYGRYDACVQTHATNTAYRLCIHIASTSTSSWTADMDSISLSKAPRSYGAPITTVYEGTFSDKLKGATSDPSLATTTITDKLIVERHGSWAHVIFNYYHTNNAGTALGSGTYYLDLSSIFAVDLVKFPQLSNRTGFGTASLGNSAGGTPGKFAFNASYPNAAFWLWFLDDVNTAAHYMINWSSTSGHTEKPNSAALRIDGEFWVPVAGWSSQVQMSNQVVRSSPTFQVFTSGSGTYAKPNGVKWIKVKMVGAGGGGGGSGASGGTGANGGNTTFGTSLLTANGGTGGTTGGTSSAGGVGGTATIGTGATGLAFRGSRGWGHRPYNTSVTFTTGPFGGVSAFGGTNVGSAAAANSGTGGAGGGSSATSVVLGNGGGAGGYIEAVITNPENSYSYAVGAAGTGGSAGTSGQAGDAGAAGVIIVEEHYLLSDAIGSIEKVSASAAVSASSANLSFASSAVEVIDFDSVSLDSHDAITTGASWRFTAPYSTVYRVSVRTKWQSTSNMIGTGLYILKGGASYRELYYHNTAIWDMQGSVIVPLNRGEYIEIRAFQQDSGSSARTIDSSSGSTYIDIESIAGI